MARPREYKSGTIIIVVDYGYDIHEVRLSGKSLVQITDGKILTIKGQGFHCEGERQQDRWQFNKEEPGSLDVYTDDLHDIYKGKISDEEVTVYVEIDRSRLYEIVLRTEEAQVTQS